LRGEINVNLHWYTPENLETMLSVLQHEFGVHPSTFHHALEVEAWQVPELLIWRAEVALHFSVGQSAKGAFLPDYPYSRLTADLLANESVTR
jgi:hypothetical protein